MLVATGFVIITFLLKALASFFLLQLICHHPGGFLCFHLGESTVVILWHNADIFVLIHPCITRWSGGHSFTGSLQKMGVGSLASWPTVLRASSWLCACWEFSWQCSEDHRWCRRSNSGQSQQSKCLYPCTISLVLQDYFLPHQLYLE